MNFAINLRQGFGNRQNLRIWVMKNVFTASEADSERLALCAHKLHDIELFWLPKIETNEPS